MNLKDITTPTLLLDEDICRANIHRMAQKAKIFGLRFKPHFKTHQSAKIGSWFKDEGMEAITVSSLKMAQYFAENDWNDITVAFPVNIRAISHINKLAGKIDLRLLVNNLTSLELLEKQLTSKLSIYLELDTGDNRTGIDPLDIEYIERLTDFIVDSKDMFFSGFYSHPGHSYSCRGKTEVKSLHQEVLQKNRVLKEQFKLNTDSYSVCLGDTPCCSVAENFDGIDEISPGNFVFYDLMQTRIGSCKIQNIAIALACPVVAKFENRCEIVVHGGAIHLSKEFLGSNDKKHFGQLVKLDSSGWTTLLKDCYVKSLSQEHGIISCSKKFFGEVSVGDLVTVLPVHSCLTANLMKSFAALNSNGKTIDQLK